MSPQGAEACARRAAMRRRLLLAGSGLGLAGLLGGCGLFKGHRTGESALRGEAGQRRQVVPFSSSPPNGDVPLGWEASGFWTSRKRTSYQTVAEQGVTIVEAESAQSASGLFCPLHIEAADANRLRWRWRTRELIENADVSMSERDDSVARLILSFDGNPGTLSFKDMLFREQALLFAGVDLPHSMLVYVWDPRLPAGSVHGVRETSRIRYLVAESGPGRLGEWVDYERDIKADFKQAFGEAHGTLLNVGVTTDANNTQGHALTYYGDIAITSD